MSILGVNEALAGAYQYANRTQKTAANGASFTEQLQKTGESAEVSKVEAYQKYLEQKYGPIMVRNVGSDQRSMDALGTGIYGMNNIAIAPNILEEMANNPEKAAEKRRVETELAYRRQNMAEFFANRTVDAGRVTYAGTPEVMSSAIAAYEQNIMEAAGILK